MNITKLFVLFLGLFAILTTSQEAKELLTIQNTLFGGEMINPDEDLLVVVSSDRVSTVDIDDTSTDPEVVFTTNQRIINAQYIGTDSPWVYILLADNNNVSQSLVAVNYVDKQSRTLIDRSIDGEFGFEGGFFVGNARVLKLTDNGEVEEIKTYAPGDELLITQTDKYIMIIRGKGSNGNTYQFISLDIIDLDNNSTVKTEVIDCEGEIGRDFDIIGVGEFVYYKCKQDLYKVPIGEGDSEVIAKDIGEGRFQLLNDEGKFIATIATTNDKSVLLDDSGNIEEVEGNEIFQVHNKFFTIVNDELYSFNLKERKVEDKLDYQPFGAIEVRDSDIIVDYNKDEQIVEAVNVNNGERVTLLTNVSNSIVSFAQQADNKLYFGVQKLTSDNYLENDTTFYESDFDKIKTSVGSTSSSMGLFISIFILGLVMLF